MGSTFFFELPIYSHSAAAVSLGYQQLIAADRASSQFSTSRSHGSDSPITKKPVNLPGRVFSPSAGIRIHSELIQEATKVFSLFTDHSFGGDVKCFVETEGYADIVVEEAAEGEW